MIVPLDRSFTTNAMSIHLPGVGDVSAADGGGSEALPDEADAAIPEEDDDLRWWCCCCIQDCVICDASSSLACNRYNPMNRDIFGGGRLWLNINVMYTDNRLKFWEPIRQTDANSATYHSGAQTSLTCQALNFPHINY